MEETVENEKDDIVEVYQALMEMTREELKELFKGFKKSELIDFIGNTILVMKGMQQASRDKTNELDGIIISPVNYDLN